MLEVVFSIYYVHSIHFSWDLIHIDFHFVNKKVNKLICSTNIYWVLIYVAVTRNQGKLVLKRDKNLVLIEIATSLGERDNKQIIKQDVLDVGNCKWEYAAFPGGADGTEPTCHCR